MQGTLGRAPRQEPPSLQVLLKTSNPAPSFLPQQVRAGLEKVPFWLVLGDAELGTLCAWSLLQCLLTGTARKSTQLKHLALL